MTSATPKMMDVTRLSELLRSSERVRLVDVRTPAEFRQAHIPGSQNVPLSLLPDQSVELLAERDDLLVLVCASGTRAAAAHKALASAGAPRVAVLEGGLTAWEAQGAEVRRAHTSHWAMERQVRLAAGLLVLIGVLGSLAFEPMKWLAGLIGTGLTIAAMTNTCGMAKMLALLPYNRR